MTGNYVVPAGIQLTIEPGTTIKVREGQYVQFAQGSTVNAVANGTSRITFTTVQDDSTGEDLTGPALGSPRAGGWEAIYMDSSSVNLDYVDIRFAGNAFQPGHGGGLVSSILVRSGASPSLKHIRLSDADASGFEFQADTSPVLDTVSIERTRNEAISQSISATPIYKSLSLLTSGGSYINLQAGTIPGDRSWDFDGATVHINGNLVVPASTTLNLAPGTIFKFSEGALFQTQGTLLASGTASPTNFVHQPKR